VIRIRHPFPALQALIVLLLAVMALQALPPQPLPLQADNGPAFSASSVEVALPARRQVWVEQKVAPVLPPMADWPEQPVAVPIATAIEAGGLRRVPARIPPPSQNVLEPSAPPRAPPVR